MTTQTVGKVLDHRVAQTDDTEYDVYLVYWGKDAEPKLTVNVVNLKLEGDNFYITAPDADILDAFAHPLQYGEKHHDDLGVFVDAV